MTNTEKTSAPGQSVVIAATGGQSTAGQTKPSVQIKNGTWKDWAGYSPDDQVNEEVMTRDELVADLTAAGVAVTTNDLLFWQKSGAMPYPTKIREGRISKAYYASWVSELVRELRDLQSRGKTLPQIRLTLLARAKAKGPGHEASDAAADHGNGADHSLAATDLGSLIASETVTITRSAPVTISIASAPRGFKRLAAVIAQMYTDEYGTAIKSVNVELIDKQGHPLLFSFDVSLSLE